MDKEDIKTCKEEAENYIEFMETAGDNAGWTRGLMWYIQHLEQKESILDKVTEFIKDDVTAEDIKFEGSKITHFIYKNLINITKEKIAEGINSYKDQIEDIIEGEKK